MGQLAYASDALVVVSFALRCGMEVIAATDYVDDSGDAMDTAERRLKNIYTSYQIIISVKVALIFLQTLLYLIIYRPLGVLVVTLGDMVADVANFGILLVLTICTFMVAFTGLQRAGSFHSELDRTACQHGTVEYDAAACMDGFNVRAKDGPLFAPW